MIHSPAIDSALASAEYNSARAQLRVTKEGRIRTRLLEAFHWLFVARSGTSFSHRRRYGGGSEAHCLTRRPASRHPYSAGLHASSQQRL